jgi:hypothetical protein
MMNHVGPEGSWHVGPGGSFYCARCEAYYDEHSTYDDDDAEVEQAEQEECFYCGTPSSQVEIERLGGTCQACKSASQRAREVAARQAQGPTYNPSLPVSPMRMP